MNGVKLCPVSPLGQIVIPKRFRDMMDIKGGDFVVFEESHCGLVVKKVQDVRVVEGIKP
jgi:AbrB family looped-hinge helix DNA binding protein